MLASSLSVESVGGVENGSVEVCGVVYRLAHNHGLGGCEPVKSSQRLRT